jgi:hypothetical protein
MRRRVPQRVGPKVQQRLVQVGAHVVRDHAEVDQFGLIIPVLPEPSQIEQCLDERPIRTLSAPILSIARSRSARSSSIPAAWSWAYPQHQCRQRQRARLNSTLNGLVT